ncbi:MAG: UDP-N-acetylmuramoyl-tripeptide--D-alanyl-D-alanine ligase [Acidimicrobiia bacterium]
MQLTRAWIVSVTDGRRAGPEADARVGEGIAFDSRTLEPGQVFVAVRGDRDGHEFVLDAMRRGSAFAVVDRTVPGVPTVEVDDVRDALVRVATVGCRRLDAVVIGITGSVGKTSTKDLIAAALRPGHRTHAAPASFNNEIGVPFTVLGAPDITEMLVVEMGARFAGNIAQLCAITPPKVGVVTNIGIAHAEHLGGPEGIAAVKGELLDALPADGLAVISADCAATAGQLHRSAAPILSVGTTVDADVRVRDVIVGGDLRPQFRLETPWGSGPVRLAVRGAHQAMNAGQAAAVALHLEVPFDAVVDALAHAEGTGWRMQLHETAGGVTVLNDAYNASPVATIAAVRALAGLPVTGRRIAVIGDMRELGPWSESEHARVGAAIAAAGVDVLVAVGAETGPLADTAAPTVEVHRSTDAESARRLVAELVRPGDAVLVKASRAIGLEVVARALLGGEMVA